MTQGITLHMPGHAYPGHLVDWRLLRRAQTQQCLVMVQKPSAGLKVRMHASTIRASLPKPANSAKSAQDFCADF